ncbi:hypothetical protein FRC02_009313 [Tulasnella sp. 418]|nr:hypothetical protein FRC02_009313 [Tulasnella sp. 418]
MHEALKFPNVIDNILDFAESRDWAVAARTCRAWNGPSLQHLYKSVDRISKLLEILAPIKWLESWTQDTFERPPTPNSWKRFTDTCAHVQELVYNDDFAQGTDVKGVRVHNTLRTVAISRKQTGFLFKNLKKLEWSCEENPSLELFPLFLSNKLEHLEMKVHYPESPDPEALNFVLRYIAGVSTSLKYFILKTRLPVSEVEDALVEVLSSVQTLEEVHLPSFFHTERVVKIMGTMPWLTTIRWTDIEGEELKVSEACSRFRFSEGWFNRLERVRVEAGLDDLRERLLKDPHRPRSLHALGFNTMRKAVNPEHLKLFLKDLASELPNITELVMDLFHADQSDTDSRWWKDRISFDHLRPLMACKKMAKFCIGHNYPLVITEDDVVELVESWPETYSLALAEDPIINPGMPKGLPISVLSILTRLPRLDLLDVYLDTKTYHAVELAKLPAFPSLTEISFGTSRVEDEVEMATILSVMCPNVKVCYGAYTWHTTLRFTESSARNHNAAWRRTALLLKSIAKYKERMEARLKWEKARRLEESS